MVGSGPSAATAASAAAAEERQKKLQEYLAAKGKLKNQNTKPYLKAKNNCPNPPPSKSTIKPKNDVFNYDVLSVKATRPISIKLQSRPANITGSQKPKLEAPKLVGKSLTSRGFSSNPKCKPSNKSHQQHEAGSSAKRELSRKSMRLPIAQKPKTTKQQLTGQANAKCTDSVDNNYVENKSLDSVFKELSKENLPQTLSEPEKKPDPALCTTSKAKTNSYNQTKSNLTPKQVSGKSLVNGAVLKDRVNNKQFVRKTQIRTVPAQLQQLSKGTDLARPEKPPRTVPSHFIQTFSRTQTSKKPVDKSIKDVKVDRGKYEQPKETKVQLYTVTEEKVKHAKPKTYLSLLQGGPNSKHPNIKQDQKSMQPCFRPQICVLQKSKSVNQRPNLIAGNFNSVIPSTPSITANRTNSFQQRAQTLDPKLKKTVPQKHFLSKTAPKTQASVTTRNGRGVPNATQTNPNIKMTTAEDRRKQLEEWKKSKGKIYKRPPMELKTTKKVIEEMNISFWKSIEEEEEEKKAQLELSNKINSTLTGCLQLIEEGVLSNEIFTILSNIPEAEKFAKFWICKAKLLARKGTFDVIGLYEEAIKNGAKPIQELREVVLNILQDQNRTTEGTTSDSLVAVTNITSMEELAKNMESGEPCLPPEERDQVPETPQITKAGQDNHPGIKLQISSIPRKNGMPEVQDMKLITPVRRSIRINQAMSHYPEMLQEHDLVVASLDELLEVEETEYFVFRKNEALPITLGFETLEP
ncbi:cytoskeleton-associated protein 2-like [Heterocephalus glaber]|uniref:Cytoskeleton-associated protein 2-like n=1 Tax=Heterocephalus glaber TaxID=10181 RepID=A0AAX6P687_HETGA|nr:cytoskeleton-associated protein 2-like [Heterocephalus glaber]